MEREKNGQDSRLRGLNLDFNVFVGYIIIIIYTNYSVFMLYEQCMRTVRSIKGRRSFNTFIKSILCLMCLVHTGSYSLSGDHQLEVRGHPLLLLLVFDFVYFTVLLRTTKSG